MSARRFRLYSSLPFKIELKRSFGYWALWLCLLAAGALGSAIGVYQLVEATSAGLGHWGLVLSLAGIIS